MAQRVLFGAFGSSIGTWPPCPSPTKTPGPILTDDLLPMMTLGCGVELDRGAVGPKDGVVLEDAAPAVVAGHVDA